MISGSKNSKVEKRLELDKTQVVFTISTPGKRVGVKIRAESRIRLKLDRSSDGDLRE